MLRNSFCITHEKQLNNFIIEDFYSAYFLFMLYNLRLNELLNESVQLIQLSSNHLQFINKYSNA